MLCSQSICMEVHLTTQFSYTLQYQAILLPRTHLFDGGEVLHGGEGVQVHPEGSVGGLLQHPSCAVQLLTHTSCNNAKVHLVVKDRIQYHKFSMCVADCTRCTSRGRTCILLMSKIKNQYKVVTYLGAPQRCSTRCRIHQSRVLGPAHSCPPHLHL